MHDLENANKNFQNVEVEREITKKLENVRKIPKYRGEWPLSPPLYSDALLS